MRTTMVSCFNIVGMREPISILIFFAILFSGSSLRVQGNPPGFISIDCGGTKPQMNYSETNLTWVDDENYVFSGKNGVVSIEVNSTVDNYEALKSFRYFPVRRSKHCYELQMRNSNISFLIRAMFLHGNSSELDLPIKFEVYINATKWTTVEYARGDDLTEPQVREGIFFMPTGGTTINVCLVPNQGVPFISSLELRELDPEGIMYSEAFGDRQHLFFSNLIRWNFGTPAEAPTVRYPEDHYDRLWTNRRSQTGYGTQRNASLPSIGSTSTGSKLNNVPSKVMMDADANWLLTDQSHGYDLPFAAPGSLVYGPAILYFDVLNSSFLTGSTPQLPIRVSIDSQASKYHQFNVSNQPSVKSFFTVLNGNSSSILFWGPYVINALEFYQQQYSSPLTTDYSAVQLLCWTSSVINTVESYQQGIFSPTTTDSSSVETINFLKKILGMTDWQGDPCTPVPYDWITCGGGDTTYYVESMAFFQLPSTSRLDIIFEDAGAFGDAFDYAFALSSLSITDSDVNDKTFQLLLTNFTSGIGLEHLDFSSNIISVFPNASLWGVSEYNGAYDSLISLDLSHNRIKYIPPFTNISFSDSLQVLNISHNRLMEDSLDTLRFSNLSSLRILDISSNYMSGSFPSNFFSDAFPSLQNLNVERNSISGELDLTIWHQSLYQAFENSSKNILNRSFSFVENNISSISPQADDFEDAILFLIKNMSNFKRTGILLGGNPYCSNTKSLTVTQRYLCRSSFSEIVYANKGQENHDGLIIGVVLGGSLALICCIVLFATTWRLWKQVSFLKKIQQAGEQESTTSVFLYNDLKSATKDFHHKNKLGSGAFGAVYKGVLADDTTVAVKRLFNLRKKQVLHEFLNEVVLLTGIKHKNLVQLKGCCIKDQERILIYEYAEKGNLVDTLWGKDNDRVLSWKDRLNICVGVARGLSYLHEELQPRIIHRDIKPANVLLDKNLNAKIADFGLAKSFYEEDNEASFTQIAGTKGYFAPEYVIDGQLTTKADVFSFGILVLEIVSGRKCIDRHQPSDQVYLRSWAQKLQEEGELLDLLEPALRMECLEAEAMAIMNIALMCVRDDPQRRPTMSQIGIMLLELMGNRLFSLNSDSTVTEQFGAGMGRINADNYSRDEEDTATSRATSEYEYRKYLNSSLLEKPEEIPIIRTEFIAKPKINTDSISGEQHFFTT